jgi:hypothetical protein
MLDGSLECLDGTSIKSLGVKATHHHVSSLRSCVPVLLPLDSHVLLLPACLHILSDICLYPAGSACDLLCHAGDDVGLVANSRLDLDPFLKRQAVAGLHSIFPARCSETIQHHPHLFPSHCTAPSRGSALACIESWHHAGKRLARAAALWRTMRNPP